MTSSPVAPLPRLRLGRLPVPRLLGAAVAAALVGGCDVILGIGPVTGPGSTDGGNGGTGGNVPITTGSTASGGGAGGGGGVGGGGGAAHACGDGKVVEDEMCFEPAVSIEHDVGVVAAVLLDCDGDGMVDVAAVDNDGKLVVFRQQANGELLTNPQMQKQLTGGAAALARLQTSSGNQLVVGHGIGTTGSLSLVEVDAECAPHVSKTATTALAVVDVAAVGLTAAARADAVALLQAGTGLGAVMVWRFGAPAPEPPVSSKGKLLTALAVADLNGDGQDDVVYSARVAGLFARLQENAGLGSTEITTGEIGDNINDIALGRLSADAAIDAAATLSKDDTKLPVLINDGKGNMSIGTPAKLEQFSPAVPIDTPSLVAATDLSGDGFDDLIGLTANSSFITILLNDGKGGFDTATLKNDAGVHIGSGDGDNFPRNACPGGDGATALVVGDLNQDQAPDILVGCPIGGAGALQLFLSNP